MFTVRSLTRYLPTRTRALELARAAAPWLGIGVALWLLYGPVHVKYFGHAFNSNRYSDDTRIQLFHFYHYVDSTLFANDVIGKYHADGTGDLFRLLYIVGSKISDPMALSRTLPIVLMLVGIAGLGVAGRNLAGKSGAFVAMAFCLGAGIVHGRLAGGLPRGFAFPFLAWCAAALTHGSPRAFAVLTVVGAGFYPVCAVLGGLTLALWLLVMPDRDRGRASGWSLRRRLIFLTITAVATAGIILPFAIRMRPHGETIKPSMLREFPEAGPGGRPAANDRAPFPPFFAAASPLARGSAVPSVKNALIPSIAVPIRRNKSVNTALMTIFVWAILIGFARLGFASAGVRRFAAFAAATYVGYVVADWMTPTLVVPERYTRYAIPVLVPLGIVAGLRGLFPRREQNPPSLARSRTIAAFVLATGTVAIVLFGGAGPRLRGRDDVTLRRGDKPLYWALKKLPRDSLVAGWPREVMNQVPLATKRTPFLTHQTHMPYHAKMTLLMRERMRALIAAYFAADDAPLNELRNKFGVTHLVVEWSHFRGTPPRYFRPFEKDISRALQKAQGHEFAVLRHAAESAIFSDDTYALLDLSRLGRPRRRPPERR